MPLCGQQKVVLMSAMDALSEAHSKYPNYTGDDLVTCHRFIEIPFRPVQIQM